jgi:cyclopropane fatty-acyl-phospholipid synthase-like methyltransferase
MKGGKSMPSPLIDPRFPRSNAYHPDWIMAGVSGAANPLWLTEWLTKSLELKPSMRVLDLGCGRGLSSIFLCREYGVEVWAADLWFDPTDRWNRVCDAKLDNQIHPMRLDARSLPFPNEYFDAVISIDSFFYFGTDDLYLAYLTRFLKPEGILAMAGAGLMREIGDQVPPSLAEWWTNDLSCLHSAEWWQKHWQASGLVDVQLADHMPDGWQFWRRWVERIAPENTVELQALDADAGQTLGYVRAIARRKRSIPIHEPITSIPSNYSSQPLLRITE